jgi:hypothetical protein
MTLQAVLAERKDFPAVASLQVSVRVIALKALWLTENGRRPIVTVLSPQSRVEV